MMLPVVAQVQDNSERRSHEPAQAQAVVLVAMAGQPISGAQELERLRADLHRFEITLARENKEWKVIHAEWRRAEPGDFL